jgi:hypothetical protein
MLVDIFVEDALHLSELLFGSRLLLSVSNLTLDRRLALCLPPTLSRKEKLTYLKLHQLTQEIDLLTDELYVMDVSTFCDDTRYFVFEVSHFSVRQLP